MKWNEVQPGDYFVFKPMGSSGLIISRVNLQLQIQPVKLSYLYKDGKVNTINFTDTDVINSSWYRIFRNGKRIF